VTAVAAVLLSAVPALAQPRIFWTSDPVRPNETVMVQGSDLGGAEATVELTKLDDSAAARQWTAVPVLQGTDQTLKFVVPAAWDNGVYACRISDKGAASREFLINAPDAWWLQGDEGDAATAGGWLRVMGKSLAIARPGGRSALKLEPVQGSAIVLQPTAADDYCLRFAVPGDMKPGEYKVQVHNGSGGDAAWRPAGTVEIKPPVGPPAATYSVLDFYGPDAAKEMRKSLVKYTQPIDRTEGILAALDKARKNGGGVAYFPAGRYAIMQQLVMPPHTVLKGEGEGLVTLWWGKGHFNLDGGGPQGRALVPEPKPPSPLIYGPDYAMVDLSIYLPFEYDQAISADHRFRMHNVRIRVDHYWLVQGRGGGTVARLGNNSQVTDCDILAKGDAIVPGQYAFIAHNRIMSNKSNTPMGGSRHLIIEDNQMISMDPTTYQNISGNGRDIYYAHNHHEALYAQQSDYSFTFDAGTGAYMGAIAEANGTQITLAGDPEFPKWATEKSDLWHHSAVCILDGRGTGQWRDLVANNGRVWQIDRPFDVAPDKSSIVTIIPFNGRTLVIGNHFEDANWVNAGYGTSIEVVYAENELHRCAEMMNYGLHTHDSYQPSWYVQFLDNVLAEGQTSESSIGNGHAAGDFTGPLTRWAIHRRQTIAADNSGSINIGGNIRDVIVEDCVLKNRDSNLKVDAAPTGVVLRNNSFEGGSTPRYHGDGIKNAVVVPAPASDH
jgi:hypothetical protein